MFRFTQEPSSGSQSQCLAKTKGMVPLNGVSVMAAYAAITLITFISSSPVEPYL